MRQKRSLTPVVPRSKGLTEAEIEQALAQAARPPQSLYGPAPHYAGHPPERGRSDWRDWLIISIVGGGTAYVLSQIAKVGLQQPSEQASV